MLHGHENLAHLHLLVLLENIDSLLVIGNGLSYYLRSVGVYLDATKHFLHLGLHVVYVYVAHDDDGLVVRTIPLLIVGTQGLRTEAVDNRHQTDGQTLTVLRAGIHLRQGALNHTL